MTDNEPNPPQQAEAARVAALEESWAEMRGALTVLRYSSEDCQFDQHGICLNHKSTYVPRGNVHEARCGVYLADKALANAEAIERKTDGK